MNSLVKVFSNFKEFYNEINGATLTGAIDVIVVEQPDGEFQCSPFHVRFGKLGVLRSREKVVDIEINGEPVDIHMKLGDSGEAFFVEECTEEDVQELPDNLATSPIPTSYFPHKYTDGDVSPNSEGKGINTSEDIPLSLPLPRRNSIDLSKDTAKDETSIKYENQISDFCQRRHTDNTLERRNLSEKIKEYTTQKLRQEWAEHEEIFQYENIVKNKDWSNSTSRADELQENLNSIITEEVEKNVEKTINSNQQTFEMSAPVENNKTPNEAIQKESVEAAPSELNVSSIVSIKEESKSKKKRRKKSQMKKKNAQRKSSSSSSIGSTTPLEGNNDELDALSISNNTNSSNDESPIAVKIDDNVSGAALVNEIDSNNANITSTATSNYSMDGSCQSNPISPTTRIPDLDIHFFSDTEATTTGGSGTRGAGARPSTPIQSDSELEMSKREKDSEVEMLSNTASWKWGELPTSPQSDEQKDAPSGQQRNSMLSGMFNFMKKTNKMRKQANDGGIYLSELDAEGMDPEMAAMYFPSMKDASMHVIDDDGESGNGTSLPHSPSSMEGQKSIDSDYDDGKPNQDSKYLEFVAMSLCGISAKNDPSDEEFDRHLVKYSDVCENPSIFSSPNLVVRLNGKYYSWAAACPIVMTIITFQKPLSDHAIEQLMNNPKDDSTIIKGGEVVDINRQSGSVTAKRSWWYWRRPQAGPDDVNSNRDAAGDLKTDDKDEANKQQQEQQQQQLESIDGNQSTVIMHATPPNSPDVSESTFSKTVGENTSAMIENCDDLTQSHSKDENLKSELFKKSLRLSSDAIKKLNLKNGMNEIEFSVTTAYQGTTRCKCYLFRWKHSDKVVISDIDGTITKSDVLGHILPMVGKDWAQLGVAQLFSKIEENGYKLLYLSARAIGQSRVTREYLRSIRQGDVKLPDGPLLLNPTSLISALHREVIEKKPEQFKIACLSDIQALFPEKNPFYAGYGNRINDVWAYRAVGIPIMRIFTINTKGELKHELTQTFQSSYCSMAYIVDQLFPPIKYDEGSIEFSNFNYWRDPIPHFDIELDGGATILNAPSSNVSTTTANSSNNNNNNNNNSINQMNSNSNLLSTKTLDTIPEN